MRESPAIDALQPAAWDGLDAPKLLTLERLSADLFRNCYNQPNVNSVLYGCQVLSQALAAAQATVDGRQIHSLHGYFLRAGRAAQRILFQVERMRDGASFSTRRVVASQSNSTIFHMQCSFRVSEGGYDHQVDPPIVPAPEELDDLVEIARSGDPRLPPYVMQRVTDPFPIDLKPVQPEQMFGRSAQPRRQVWFRVPSAALVEEPNVHRLILAYLSDYWLSGTALLPHTAPVPSNNLVFASLDHGLWFHRYSRVDDWLLYDTDSPSASCGTGISRGLIYDRAGRLLASSVQESLQRIRGTVS
jgi:acyl-CoA thioesterase-2